MVNDRKDELLAMMKALREATDFYQAVEKLKPSPEKAAALKSELQKIPNIDRKILDRNDASWRTNARLMMDKVALDLEKVSQLDFVETVKTLRDLEMLLAQFIPASDLDVM
ncbi:MAG TPA: hypothetical protein VMO47_10530 [Rhodothermales bacterium]|nr:hypothetical protein [Rhodothermales bacterium]